VVGPCDLSSGFSGCVKDKEFLLVQKILPPLEGLCSMNYSTEGLN
jgi:hypothetical protein